MGDLLKTDTNDKVNAFYNNVTSHFFAPYILQPTRPKSKTLIDNILINSVAYPSHRGNLTIQISDHIFQFVILEGFFKELVPKKINIFERNYLNFNEREFTEALTNMDWDQILSIEGNDPNISMNNLHQHINYLLDEFAPHKKLAKKEYKLKSKPWINRNILTEMKKRDKLLHKYCKAKDKDSFCAQAIYEDFKFARNSLTKMKRDSKIDYYRKYFEVNKNKASSIWKGIRSIVNIQNSSKKDIKLLNDKGSNISDPKKIVDLFNKYFVKVGPNIDERIPKAHKHFTEYMSKLKVNKTIFLTPANPREIYDIISAFDIKKSLGPNSIPVYILKISNNFFSDKLTRIFPDLCKLAKIIPISKKDSPFLCGNYLPISLLPIFSKIFEKVIYKRMYNFAEQNKLIYERQFGFRARHSTNYALINTTESIKSQIDQGNYVGGVFIDLQKAFDTVNHDILCEKLAYYGFRGNCQLLIRSFLSNRQQFVSINGFDSSKLDIKCGVPQGSTLGPLLFLLYINDLQFALKDSIASHFADDTCILYASNKSKSIETVLNCDLKLASDWLNANRISLNIDKSKLLIFKSKQRKFNKDSISIKLGGVKLIPTDNVKYLGLHLDQNLSWDIQTNQLSKKLSKANVILAKLRHFALKETLISVYYSIFHSHVQYGCPVWSLTKKENLDTITILQKKCMRIINFVPFNSHTNNMFLDNKRLKFDDLIKVEQLKPIFDFKN